MEDLDGILIKKNEPEVGEEMSEDEIRNRDEFFQSLIDSQCLSSVSEEELTVELVREMCYRYALNAEWVKNEVTSDAKKGTTNADEPWEAYLFAIRFTADDVIRIKRSPNEEERKLFNILTRDTYGPTLVAPIAGRSHIELKMIEAIFQLHLRCDKVRKPTGKAMSMALEEGMAEDGCSPREFLGSRGEISSGIHLTGKPQSYDSFRSPTSITITSFNIIDDESRGDNNRLETNNNLPPMGRVHSAVPRKSRSISKHLSSTSVPVPPPLPKNRSSPFDLFKKRSKLLVEDKVEFITPIEKPTLVPEPYETRKLKVNDRLEKFVDYLVKEFEAKLMSYVMLSEGGEGLEERRSTLYTRIGQVCGGVVFGAVGGVTAATLGLSGVKDGAEFGSKVGGKVAKTIQSKLKTGKVKSLDFLIDYYRNQKPEFRRTLVEVGYDIFQSFEMQFVRMTSERGGSKMALHVLAIDVTNRIIDYMSRNEPEIKENLHSLLIEGVVLGKSKLDLANLGKRGFEITYEYEGVKMKWMTGVMLERVGVTEEGKMYRSKDRKSRSDLFGYRRLFSSENWTELSSKLEADVEIEAFSDYEYIVNARKMKRKAKKMFQKLDEENDLEDERMEKIVRETKEEMMEGIIVLKGLSRDFKEDFDKLTQFQEELKSLKIEEFSHKLEMYLNAEETKSVEMEMLIERLNEMDLKFDGMDEKLNKLCEYLFQKSAEQ